MTVPTEKATANHVPAAAVIREWQALSGIIGRKGRVGGPKSRMINLWAQPIGSIRNSRSRVQDRKVELSL